MSPTHHKDDFFIAEYTLGLLEPDDIAQAHALLGEDDDAVVCALRWEARLLELTDALTPLHPPAQLLERIQSTLGLPRGTAAAAPPTRLSKPSPSAEAPSSASASEESHSRPSPPLSFAGPPASTAQPGNFEPRLIRPDSASFAPAPVQQPAVSEPPSRHANAAPAGRSAINAAPTPAPHTPRVDGSTRVRNAPPDPTEVFRREAASRSPARRSIWRSLWFWRALSISLAVLATVLVLPDNTFKGDPALASLQTPAAPEPTVVQVAVLQAPGTSSTPGWVLTVDSRQNVVLQPQVDIIVPESEAVYLWTYNEQTPQPRLLGMVDPARSLTLPVEVTGEVAPGQIFEMTQEPNLVPPREPEGPILFIGRTISLG